MSNYESLTLLWLGFTAFSTLGLLILGIYGYGRWLNEVKAKERFEMTKRAFTLLRQIEQQFQYIRSLYIGQIDIEDLKNEYENKGLINKMVDDVGMVKLDRLQGLDSLMSMLDDVAWEFVSYWDDNEVEAYVEKYRTKRKDLRSAIGIYFDKTGWYKKQTMNLL